VSGLACLQHGFQDYLLHREQRITDQLIVTPRCSAQERLSIYGDGYRQRLLAALETNFPALHALLGDMAFDRLGRAYIDAHPSQHPSLRWFGRQVSKFLRQTPLYASQPILAEMAAFEWAQGEVFDAEDADVIAAVAARASNPLAFARTGRSLDYRRLHGRPQVRRTLRASMRVGRRV
jgi:hypothetical protein